MLIFPTLFQPSMFLSLQVWWCHLWHQLCISLYFWACAHGGPVAKHLIRWYSAVCVYLWLYSVQGTWLDFICTSYSSSRRSFHQKISMPGEQNSFCVQLWAYDAMLFYHMLLQMLFHIMLWQILCVTSCSVLEKLKDFRLNVFGW